MHIILAQQLPVGQPITLDTVDSLIRTVAHFLIGISMVIAVIMFIVAGIMMMTGNEKLYKQGKAMVSQVIWGSAVILGIGLILNTIGNIVTLEFFNYCQLNIFGVCIW